MHSNAMSEERDTQHRATHMLANTPVMPSRSAVLA
jgi:hypothetical protein